MAGGVCKYFLQGNCRYGERCNFRHPDARVGSGGGGYGDSAAYGRQSGHGAENDSSRGRVCQHYLKGSCTFGDRCKFEHPNRSMAGYARYEEKQPRNNVCKHYLNGTCRFGDSCKFEHPSSGWSTGGHMQRHDSRPDHAFNSNSVKNPQGRVRFQFSQQDDWADGIQDGGLGLEQGGIFREETNTSLMPSTPQDIVQMVRGDILEGKMSHMWPLSCYGIAGKCLPELKDISPEELRWAAYLGRHTGTVQEYIQAEGALFKTQRSVQSHYENISLKDASLLLQTVHSNNPFAAAAAPTASLFSSSTSFTPPYGGGPLLTSGGLQSGSHGTSLPLFGTSDHLSSSSTAPSLSNTSGPVLEIPKTGFVQVVGGCSGTKPSSEQCTQEELAMYNADRFLLGHIPEHAPPQSVC